MSRVKSVAYPYYISWFFAFLGLHIAVGLDCTFSDLLNSIFELSFLDMAGFKVGYYANSVAWYLSALFMNIIIFAPIIEKFGTRYIQKVAPVVSVFLYGILALNSSFLFAPHTVMFGLIYKGMIRCAAGINAGFFIYGLHKNAEFLCSLKKHVKLAHFIQISTFIITIGYLVAPSSPDAFRDYFCVIILFLLLTTTLCTDSVIERTLEKVPLVLRMGKFSIYIYFSQAIVYSQKERLHLWNLSNYYKIFVFVVLCFGAAFLVYGIELLCRKIINSLRRNKNGED